MACLCVCMCVFSNSYRFFFNATKICFKFLYFRMCHFYRCSGQLGPSFEDSLVPTELVAHKQPYEGKDDPNEADSSETNHLVSQLDYSQAVVLKVCIVWCRTLFPPAKVWLRWLLLYTDM